MVKYLCFRTKRLMSGSIQWGLSFFFALLVGINMPVSMWCLSACHVVSTSPCPGILSSWLKFWMWSLRPSRLALLYSQIFLGFWWWCIADRSPSIMAAAWSARPGIPSLERMNDAGVVGDEEVKCVVIMSWLDDHLREPAVSKYILKLDMLVWVAALKLYCVVIYPVYTGEVEVAC